MEALSTLVSKTGFVSSLTYASVAMIENKDLTQGGYDDHWHEESIQQITFPGGPG
jgi:hypothetical protein